MPVYLVHGFRWPREGFSGIRVHAILHNLEDTSVEYIQNENSKTDILASFHKAYPEIMKELDAPGRTLEFIEQYNPEDTESDHAVSQPYAYVGDKVVTIAANPGDAPNLPLAALNSSPVASQGQTGGAVTSDPPKTAAGASKTANPSRIAALEPTALSMNVEEVISEGPGLTNRAWEALADLRDKIASGEKIGWWVVYNGDPQRAFDDYDDDDEYDGEYEDGEMEDVVEEDEVRKQQQQLKSLRHSQQQQQGPQSRSTLASPTSTSTVRPRTAPSTDAQTDSHPQSYMTPRLPQVPTSPLPHIASQQLPQPQGDLTALPVRPAAGTTGLRTSAPYPPPQPPELTSPGRGDRYKGKGKQTQQGEVDTAPKVKEVVRTQGLRKKLFGKRI
ncbi:uncharacterized protein A1O9_01931 [Exophiala aquamarina CBS 119918]|uniref:Uncharacterized protein n=1 Tax=Exophiala aquamarina CBS 119918 TaxID=1182545 RepID=A0A072PKH5_9EURO|nr:uncharacterized protein A1O9_01931 [Exophiala aquamarina CBS 119918]KEF60371.1 hypothetical protein A1O9_01931 [Exophiala aquamarina CBS 119918]